MASDNDLVPAHDNLIGCAGRYQRDEVVRHILMFLTRRLQDSKRGYLSVAHVQLVCKLFPKQRRWTISGVTRLALRMAS